MSTTLTGHLLLTVITGIISLDLGLYWLKRRHRTGFWNLLRRWGTKSSLKLSIAGLVAVAALALYLHSYSLFSRLAGKLSKTVLWGVAPSLGMISYIFFDLVKSWRSFRTDRKRTDITGKRFYLWWLRKSGAKFCATGGVVCLLLGGVWMTYRYNLLQLKSESSGYMASALSYYEEKKFREATLELRNAITQNRGDCEARLWLARTYCQLGALADARTSYRAALRIDPKLYDAHLELSKLYFVLMEPEAAIAEANQALLLSPQEPELHALLARFYSATGRRDQVEQQYRAILTVDPSRRNIRKELIDLLLGNNYYDEARHQAEAGLREKPGDMELQVSLAVIRDAEGGRSEAEENLRDLASKDLTSPLPLIALGDLFIHHREHLSALKYYEEALDRSPDQVAVMNNIALLHAEYGYDLQRAEELASRAYSRRSGDPGLVDTLGWVLLKQGKLEQALSLLQSAVTRAPQVPDVHYHYGAALLKAGRRAEGREELKTALKISPGFEGATKARMLLQHGT